MDDLWKYSLDDLDRSRQDELPLDNHEKRVSYAPSRRNGADHIPKKVKLAFGVSWGNPIRDEESEQTEGLTIEEMPWRKNAEKTIPHMGQKVEPMLPPRPRPRQMPLQDNTTMIVPVRNSPPPITDNHVPILADDHDPLQDCDLVVNPPPEGATPRDWTFYNGSCMVYPNKDPRNRFVATFEMIMSSPNDGVSPEGTLSLSAHGLAPRAHSVTALNDPCMRDGYCILSTTGTVSQASYRLQLKDGNTTNLFAACLQGLQKTVRALQASETLIDTSEAQSTPPLEDEKFVNWALGLVEGMNEARMKEIERAVKKRYVEQDWVGNYKDQELLLDAFASILRFKNTTLPANATTGTGSTVSATVSTSMNGFLGPIRWAPDDLLKHRNNAVRPSLPPGISREKEGLGSSMWASEV